MHGLSVEYRNPMHASRSRDLAQDIARRSIHGRVVVVAEKPIVCLSAVRKQWVRIIRRTHIERARTLNKQRINELSYELVRLQEIGFSAKTADVLHSQDVLFATADDLARLAPACSVLYVTYAFPKEKLYLMTSWMPRNGLVVIYGQK